MPIEIIVPDATTTPDASWTANPHTVLSDQGANLATCAGSNVGKSFIVSFGNLHEDIASINSITFSVAGLVGVLRGVSGVCSFDLLNASDTSYSLSENKTFNDTTLPTLQAGTERTTSDGSAAWTESDVNALRMKVIFASIANSLANINLDFIKIDVDYNPVIPPTYDTTINSIHVASGNIDVTSGNIFI